VLTASGDQNSQRIRVNGARRTADTTRGDTVDFMHAELAAIAANLAGAVIALDFDGTLAPIVADPASSRPVPGVLDTLIKLAHHGSQIAIVTGRDARTVLALGELDRIPGVIISGLHGAETWHDGQLSTRDEPPGLDQLRVELPPLLAELDPQIWLEDKRLSLVVHTRRAAEPERALSELSPVVSALAQAHGLEAHPGKLVLEIRIAHLSKADAVNALLNEGTSAALFAGDDLGDLPAFAVVREWSGLTRRPALTIAVGEVEQVRSAADLQLASPEQLAALLADLSAL
jgi:trehalose 6-phosphate phosphatase